MTEQGAYIINQIQVEVEEFSESQMIKNRKVGRDLS